MNGELFIPTILGTSRRSSNSRIVSNFIGSIIKDFPAINTTLIDPTLLALKDDGKDEADRNPTYSDITNRADGFIIVVPEYNHSFPGSLKRMLDSEYDNYHHKPVSFVGVSTGSFGGSRAIEALLPVVRALGLVACTKEVNIGNVESVFDSNGGLLEDSFIPRTERMITELLWMANALKNHREYIESFKGGDL